MQYLLTEEEYAEYEKFKKGKVQTEETNKDIIKFIMSPVTVHTMSKDPTMMDNTPTEIGVIFNKDKMPELLKHRYEQILKMHKK